MNNDLNKLQPYPFEKLAQLKAQVTAPEDKHHIPLSIGEPKHAAPAFIFDSVRDNLNGLQSYPKTKGSDELRQTIASWISQRFLQGASIDPSTQVLPVNGTREALFSFTQAVINRQKNATVLTPNPFYQIYEGAALLAGATPVFLPCLSQNDFLPNLDSINEIDLKNCQLFFLCSPGNPTGTVADADYLERLIALADKYDFIIASDECYSELYQDEGNPPTGLLEVCQQLGRTDFKRCVVFHSLSKRSNVPGLRSGFVAGDGSILKSYLLYRTYHGCAMSDTVQQASIAAWCDEQHVQENRILYRKKYQAFQEVLANTISITVPPASFYIWLQTPIDDRDFAQALFAEENITVLPGQFLSREVNGVNPGKNRVRLALVSSLEDCIEAAQRIKSFWVSQGFSQS